MATIEYRIDDKHYREANTIKFDIPDDMNIEEYKIICMRLAYALGYQHSSIQNMFSSETNKN